MEMSQRAREGFEALQAGNPRAAFELLSEEATERPNDPAIRMGLAFACRDTGDHVGEVAELERVLEIQPRNFLALVMRGDAALKLGRKAEAASFFNAAITVAPPPDRRPAHIQAHLERAHRLGRELMAGYEAFLRKALGEEGFEVAPDGPGAASEALDILFGRRKIYAQEPEQFFWPGLPQRQFYDRSEFTWASALEAQTDAIAEEARAVMALEDGFQAYLHVQSGPKTRESHLQDNTDWSAAYLIKSGTVNEAVAKHCPHAMAALEDVPLCTVPGKNPSVLFSMLRPKTRIDPHHGMLNTRLICHLPLIVPGACVLRVGNQRHVWRRGELTVFDDSIEHEAENMSDEPRIVLLFDIWRPELNDRDRAFLARTFQLISSYP